MGSVQEGGSSNGTMLMAGAGLAGGSLLGLKDWVTPYKLSVLVLLSEMSSTNPPTDPPTPTPPISLHHRRSLNLLILPLQQGPDLTFQQFVSTVEECCPPIIPTIKHRLFSMADRELQDLDQFFSTLSRCFSDSEVFKTSVVGLFVRQMLLAYNKLTFSQVYKLYKALQQYCSSEQRPHNDLSTITNEDMELTANEDVSMNTTQKKKTPTFNQSDLLDCLYQSEPWTDEGCGPLSQKQAEYFLARQAYMLKNDENRALTPDQLQDKLNNILKFNPDFAEAHYVSYLNSVRVQDVFTSTHSLLHYFDRLVLSTTDNKSNGDDGFAHSLRYAVLNLATLHCHFNHHQQADLALQEAIRIAQEANDHVCLQHCLSWLYTLEQMKGSDSAVLTEDSVKMAAHFCLPYLACLGVQSLVQRGALLGFSAPQLLDAQRRTSVLLWKQSLSELIEIGLAQSASLWNMYGKSTMAVQQSQLLLNMNSLEPMNFGIQQNNTESFAVVLSHLAQLHAEQGLYAAASDIIKHLKHQFPPHTQHARIWMLCDLNIQFEKAMNDGKYHLAEPHVTSISALDSTEGLYRKAELLRALNRTSEASRLLQQLQQQCEENKNPELTIRVMLSSAELHWNSSCYSAALPLLLKALSLSRQHNLQRLECKTVLHLAYIQLMLGVPEQALVLVCDVLECVLAHGALMEKSKALLLMARCQAALSAAQPHNQHHLTAAAVCTLDEASVYLLQLNCKQRLRDVYYLQARLHHTLRNHAQRNRCALMFRLLNQDLLHAPATPPHML